MILSNLEITNFRCIKKVTLTPHPSLNLVDGSNGSGKSSVLEAIQCLATGHSFRTRKPKELISHHDDHYQLTSTFINPDTQREHRTGLSRHRDGTVKLRLDYEDVSRQTDIASLLPVKAITPGSHSLVQDGPDERRQFLDWGLFHVEPGFIGRWRDYKRALSQRNQLLRNNAIESDIIVWNHPLVKSAMALHESRLTYINKLIAALDQRQSTSDLRFHVKLTYRRGWDSQSKLYDLMEKNLETHRKMKTTTDGPHRSDLHITVEGVPAKQTLSRGQQKVLVYLLHLSQLDILKNETNKHSIVLCDDLTSELDAQNSETLLGELNQLGSQVFVTGVTLGSLVKDQNQRFHMEHGELKKDYNQ